MIWSFTSFSMLKYECPKKFHYKYILKHKPKLRQNCRPFLEGSALHKVWEFCFKKDNPNGGPITKPLDEALALKVYPTIFDQVVVEQKKQGNIVLWNGETIESIKANGLQILKDGIRYLKMRKLDEGEFYNEYSIGSYMKPLELAKGLWVQGSTDWLKIDGDVFDVADFKTSKDTEYIHPAQLLLYILALEKTLGKKARKAFFLMLRDGSAHNLKDIDVRKELVLQEFLAANEMIKKGVFVATPSKKVCKNCQWRNDCKDSLAKDTIGQISLGVM
jgi:CRISPR/Cas system-associated exonuclease Cas4 (RecB family)